MQLFACSLKEENTNVIPHLVNKMFLGFGFSSIISSKLATGHWLTICSHLTYVWRFAELEAKGVAAYRTVNYPTLFRVTPAESLCPSNQHRLPGRPLLHDYCPLVFVRLPTMLSICNPICSC
ncbi:hypothetical protein S83_017288 [Arachis hypogaea]